MKWLSSLRRDAEDPDVSSEGPAAIDSVSSVPAPSNAEEVPSSEMPTTVEPSPFVAASPPAGGLESPPAGDSLSAEQLKQLLGESLQSLLQPVSDSQKALQEQFAARIRSDEVQAKALETLHDDLKQYKANFVRQQMLPLLKEVIFCHDFVAAQVSRAAGEAQGESSPAASALAATRQMLLDLLFKYDVEPYQGESEMFDPKIQQCARTVPTGRAEADKTIAGRTQTGFRSPDGIVRREQVTVYKFTPGAE